MKDGLSPYGTRYNGFMAYRQAVLPFGKALKIRRDRLGLTQNGLAEKMGGTVDQSTVSKWEVRATPLRDRFLLDGLADALDCTVQELIEGRVPAEWAGVFMDNEPTNLLGGDWVDDAIRAYAPNTSPARARALLEAFDGVDPSRQDALIEVIEGMIKQDEKEGNQ